MPTHDIVLQQRPATVISFALADTPDKPIISPELIDDNPTDRTWTAANLTVIKTSRADRGNIQR